MFGNPLRPPINELFVSKNLKTAVEYMTYLRKWGEGLAAFDPKICDVSTWTTELARLPYGEIKILSSDPDGFRGLGGEVTLDEFDFHDQQPALYSAANSRADWIPEGQLSVFSSRSYNPSTFFATLSEDFAANPSKDLDYECLTLDDCVREGLAFRQPGDHLKFLDGTEAGKQKCLEAFYAYHKGKCASEEDFRREYFWEATGQSQLITPGVYSRCVLGAVPDTLNGVRGELFVGVDCGRSKDLTVVWVLQRRYHPKTHQPHYFTVCVKSVGNLPFPEQHKLIAPIVTNPYARGLIDQGAQGRALADSVAAETGNAIMPFGFSAPRKMEMAERLRAFAQEERISFPDDPQVRQSLLCITKKVNEKGGLSYEGQTRIDHGDWFWAAALALHAAESREGKGNFSGGDSADREAA